MSESRQFTASVRARLVRSGLPLPLGVGREGAQDPHRNEKLASENIRKGDPGAVEPASEFIAIPLQEPFGSIPADPSTSSDTHRCEDPNRARSRLLEGLWMSDEFLHGRHVGRLNSPPQS